ncbi:hypothetical protein HY523_00050 [Candidatus Berkelbacteria bacterium]|nr:hypothetical protein [Candidatus Berkelbacteria bacterium]
MTSTQAAPGQGPIVAWEASEFLHREKGFGWLVIIWVVGILLATGAIIYYHWSLMGIATALVPLAGALALTTQGRIRPKTMRIAIDESGVVMGDQHLVWTELKGFWFHLTAEQQILYLETTRRLLSIVPIQLGKVDPEMVRSIFVQHLPERTDHAEELSDRLARLIRF